ncbi:Ubiquinol-cytochrome-c reductase complex assembly factor 1 [Halocaridina rubra]|uniref:Ubiquinol-cytochrome-c reductase complex assembly factor 1 n=1 Tax=Halocaridina rubra TaxID=373956 RepID=A0AAN8WFV4_HALRR
MVYSYNVNEARLHKDLFENYDKITKPTNRTTRVDLHVNIKHFDMEWKDARLRWNPREYDGIEQIHVPHVQLWKPDIEVYNRASAEDEMHYGETMATIFSKGRILFVPQVKLHFTCTMDLTYWPHDKHNCTCILGSAVHDVFDIELRNKYEKPEADLPMRFTAGGLNLTRSSWDILNTDFTRIIRPPYMMLHMTIEVSRNAPAYEWTIKGPAVGLSILTLVLFFMPPAIGEKLIFGGLCLLLDLLFIFYTNMTISMAPNHTPLIVQMICEQAMLVIGSIVVGSVSFRFARDPHSAGLPPIIKRPIIVLSSCICLRNYRNMASRAHRQAYIQTLKPNEFEMKENGNGPNGPNAQIYRPDLNICPGFDWLLLAAFIDRICLIIYVIVFIVFRVDSQQKKNVWFLLVTVGEESTGIMIQSSVRYLLHSPPTSAKTICQLFNLTKRGVSRSLCTSSQICNFECQSKHKRSDVVCLSQPYRFQVLPHVPVPGVQRFASTVAGQISEPGKFKRLVKKMGWLEHSKSKLRRSGYILYTNVEKIDIMNFFEVCELPDTFFSWFLVIELHVWMMMVRLMAEGEEGRFTRNSLVEAMWEDVQMRAKKLECSASACNEQIQEIVGSFQTALFTYDEGLLGDDKALASALWRRLFSRNCSDPERIECCVHYVRMQIANLDSLPRKDFMLDCKLEWLPMHEKRDS